MGRRSPFELQGLPPRLPLSLLPLLPLSLPLSRGGGVSFGGRGASCRSFGGGGGLSLPFCGSTAIAPTASTQEAITPMMNCFNNFMVPAFTSSCSHSRTGGRRRDARVSTTLVCKASATATGYFCQAFYGLSFTAEGCDSHRMVGGRTVSCTSCCESRRRSILGVLSHAFQRLTTILALLTLPLPSMARSETVCSPSPSMGSSSA